ncbi:MAG: ATP-binding cassette domain-containing protein [Methanocellales archaeon]
MIILEAIGVCYRYPNGVDALRNVNMQVNEGEILGLLGPNGCGKTTLLLHLNGILQPQNGEIRFKGKRIKYDKKSLRELREKIGMVFQNPDDQIISPTVWEEVAFGPVNLGWNEDMVNERVNSALSLLQIAHLKDKPSHYISFGEKKKLSIASIIAMDPEVLLLDEPTSNLDPKSASWMMKIIYDLNKKKGKTIIIATHDIDLAPVYVDKICLMMDGRIIKSGTPSEVLSDRELIRATNLRLPRVGHLIEVLMKEDGLNFNGIPLTIGEARRLIRSSMRMKD